MTADPLVPAYINEAASDAASSSARYPRPSGRQLFGYAPLTAGQSRGGLQGGGVASVHKFVLVSRFAPVTLSSSGAEASEAQPDTNQTTASTLIMVFMGLLFMDKVEKHVIPLPFQSLAVILRVDCGIWQSCYRCDLATRCSALNSRRTSSSHPCAARADCRCGCRTCGRLRTPLPECDSHCPSPASDPR
jgi:hypothetical protein